MRYTFEDSDVTVIAAHVESVTGNRLGGHYITGGVQPGSTAIVDKSGDGRVFDGLYSRSNAVAYYMAMALTIARDKGEEMPQDFVKYRVPMTEAGLIDGHADFEAGKQRAMHWLRTGR